MNTVLRDIIIFKTRVPGAPPTVLVPMPPSTQNIALATLTVAPYIITIISKTLR